MPYEPVNPERMAATRQVTIALKKPRHSIVESLIAWFDYGGPYCHAEIYFPDQNKSFACHAGSGAAFYTPKYDQQIGQWDFVVVPWNELRVMDVCRACEGDHYDYLGCVNFILRRFLGCQLPRIKGWWFCSAQVSLDGTVAAGDLELEKETTIGPNELASHIRGTKLFRMAPHDFKKAVSK